MPDLYEFLEAEGYRYAIRLPANAVLQESIAWLLKRPVGRPPHEVRRYHASFSYQAGSWTRPRRVVPRFGGIRAGCYRGSGSLGPNIPGRASGGGASSNKAAPAGRGF